ncbi:MAG: TonB family protein [Caulobacteraceae bacterium]|nr:TonB family protein [Caulobacteraceae bacterium]
MVLISLLALALEAGTAARPPQTPPETVGGVEIVHARWLTGPRVRYPRAAYQHGRVPGRVVLTCIVRTDGRLRDCHVDSEDPAGLGFAEAAVAGAADARLSPRTENGVPAEERVTFPVSFRFLGR